VRDFVAWLATQPGGAPFHLALVTETAVRGYMDFLATTNRAPRTRSKALSALRRFCQWAVDEGHLRRNPARPNTYIDSVAEIGKKLILMRWPSLRLQNERHASWAEEAEAMKYP
jgi:site-specific recombinase XerD